MIMRTLLLLSVFFSMLLCAVQSPLALALATKESVAVLLAASPEVIGEAHDLSTGEFAYRELHYYSADKMTHRVVYRGPNNVEIAHKDVDYRTGLVTPRFRQHNFLYDEILEVSWNDGYLDMAYTASAEQERDHKKLKASQPIIIDAGFDHFMREHWQDLLSGKKLKFSFPVATRLMLVTLQVQSKPCSYAPSADQCFQIDAANWLVRMLMDPIEIGYSVDTKKLQRFRGLANIADANGNGMEVDIRYSY